MELIEKMKIRDGGDKNEESNTLSTNLYKSYAIYRYTFADTYSVNKKFPTSTLQQLRNRNREGRGGGVLCVVPFGKLTQRVKPVCVHMQIFIYIYDSIKRGCVYFVFQYY
jgi:hypothetical protein